MILDKDTKTSPTIDGALMLVGKKAQDYEGWKLKGLGLRLVLLGLAEMQALRLSSLAGIVYELEGKLLDDEIIRNLEPKQLFQLYQLATKSLVESSDYIERTLKATNWGEMETELLQAKAKQVSGSEETQLDSATAQELLGHLARMQQNPPPPEQFEEGF